MSRIGKKPIDLPSGVKVEISGSKINVQGTKGKLDKVMPAGIKLEVKDNQVIVTRPDDSKKSKSLHGLVRNLVANMVEGVNTGFSKELEIRGVGFRAQVTGKSLNLQLGFSHPIDFAIPEGITIEAPKPTELIVKGIDKEQVGQVTAKIRNYYKPEPYKGKGIRYKDEYVRHKVGKAVA